MKLVRLTIIGLALAFAGAAVQVGPALADASDDLREADRAFDVGDYKKAAKKYDDAIRRGPSTVGPAGFAKRAAIYIITKQYEAGLKFLTDAERRFPDAPELLEQKALVLWQLGSKPDAVTIAEKVVGKRPDAYSNQLIISEFYYPRDTDKVIAASEGYLSTRPGELEGNDVLPRLRLGFAYLEKGHRLETELNEQTKDVKNLYRKAEEQFELVRKKHRKRAHAEVNAENGLCAVYTVMQEADKAINTCSKIIQNPRRVDRRGSVWFNLATAYLQSNQPQRARTAANEFVRMRKSEPRGYMIIGDSYFQERNWERALEAYGQAEKLAKDQHTSARIDVKLASAYLETGKPEFVRSAIEKFEKAYENDPNNIQIASRLATAYMMDKQDVKALALADRRIGAEGYDQLDERVKVTLQLIAARASYNQSKHDKALEHYVAAYELRPKDVQVRIGLVQTVNYQAYQSFKTGKLDIAERHLTQALQYDEEAPITNQNLAVLALDRGECGKARKHLGALEKQRNYQMSYHRLMARSYLCDKKPDTGKASQHFARAEKAAAEANLVRAEIYTEWAPLIWDKDLDDAISKLETAVQFTVQNKDIGPAAQRNLALALFRRGWRHMKKGNSTAAAADFERATRNPQLLKGSETVAFDFSLALALLDKGDTTEASKLLEALGKKGNAGAYMKAPYDKVGPAYFAAYAKYRSGNATLREQSAGEFAQLTRNSSGKFGAKVRDLAASAYHWAAFDEYRRGRTRTASTHLGNANRYAASPGVKRTIEHNQAVLDLGTSGTKNLSTFERMGASPAEALANLGILYDRAGKPKEAYDAWVQARAKGVRDSDLNNWIDAKKRIFGY